VVRNGILYTPPMAASILPGITRDSVITIAKSLGYSVHEEMIPREMLYIADELFFAGTAVEITPIRSVDRIVIGAGKRGEVTSAIQQAFFGIINGELPDTHHWLTYVYDAPAGAATAAAAAKA
jgi:branched-chain amino acid aminotransferase